METVVTYEKQGMLPKVDKYILLSTSPRRKDLLTFLNPEIMSVDVDERAIQDHYMKVFKTVYVINHKQQQKQWLP